jgi:hypothetical protein
VIEQWLHRQLRQIAKEADSEGIVIFDLRTKTWRPAPDEISGELTELRADHAQRVAALERQRCHETVMPAELIRIHHRLKWQHYFFAQVEAG